MTEDYRLFVNKDRTVLVRFWKTGNVEVSTRDNEAAIWSPPMLVTEEK